VVANTGDAGHSRAARRLNAPRPAAVVASPGGRPASVDRIAVALVREEWRVRERWWTEEPLRRTYFDLVLATGENVVVFLDDSDGRWFRQRG